MSYAPLGHKESDTTGGTEHVHTHTHKGLPYFFYLQSSSGVNCLITYFVPLA